jgi:NNP family nitrate/nitrite transporter-like MFS transporter
VFLGFYVVCAVVTWFVFLRLQEHRAHSGEHIGRTTAPVPVG